RWRMRALLVITCWLVACRTPSPTRSDVTGEPVGANAPSEPNAAPSAPTAPTASAGATAPQGPNAPTENAPTAPVPPVAPARPVKVRIVIRSVPPRALVNWGKLKLGPTPVTLERPGDSGPIDLIVRSDGYFPLHTRAYTFRSEGMLVRLTK